MLVSGLWIAQTDSSSQAERQPSASLVDPGAAASGGVHWTASFDHTFREGVMTHGPLQRGRISDLNVGDLLVRNDIGEVEVTRLDRQTDGHVNVHYRLDDSLRERELPERWMSTHARFRRSVRSADSSADDEAR
jgi:hypothetical protein